MSVAWVHVQFYLYWYSHLSVEKSQIYEHSFAFLITLVFFFYFCLERPVSSCRLEKSVDDNSANENEKLESEQVRQNGVFGK